MVSSSNLLALGMLAAVAFFDGAAAYWAIRIRQSLVSKLYRNQALGMALVAILLAVFFIGTLTQSYLQYGELFASNADEFGIVAGPILFLFVFYWVDASALAGRMSDPLLRDTFHWLSVRKIIWPFLAVGNALTLAVDIIYFQEIYIQQVNSATLPIEVGLGQILILPELLVPTLLGSILLLVVGSRSKDGRLRANLRWFGIAVGFIILSQFAGAMFFSAAVSSAEFLYGVFIVGLGWALGGYFLYRSARSLVPLNKLSLSSSE